MNPQNKLAHHLRSLHKPGNPLILTNAYDAATATIIASLPSAHAVATASFAIASSLGVDDTVLTKGQNLSALKSITSAVHAVNRTKPITVGLQDGYGSVAELAATIKEVIELGAVGCNIEDLDNGSGELRVLDDAVERVRTVVRAATEAGVFFPWTSRRLSTTPRNTLIPVTTIAITQTGESILLTIRPFTIRRPTLGSRTVSRTAVADSLAARRTVLVDPKAGGCRDAGCDGRSNRRREGSGGTELGAEAGVSFAALFRSESDIKEKKNEWL